MTKPPTWISIAVVRLQQTKTESSGARATGARPAKVFVTDTILLACIFFWQQVRKERVFIPGHLCAGLPQLHRCHEQCKQPFKVFEISQLCLFVCLSHLGSLVNCHAPDLCVVFHLVFQLEVRRPPERAGRVGYVWKSLRSNLQRDPASSPAKRLPSLKRSFLTVTGPVGPLSSPPPIPPPTPSPTGP